MNKKTIAIILELIPVISAPLSYILLIANIDSEGTRTLISILMLLGLLGCVFFFVGRKLVKEDRTVKILGILDWLATLFIIGIFILAVLSFGL